MKKENWILMLSVISIVLSIIAILIWLCEYHPVTWSLLDSCFAVLSAGMTLFVASQVYHSFTLTRKIEEKKRNFWPAPLGADSLSASLPPCRACSIRNGLL